MTEYLDTSRPFPYCAGCGHPHVLRALDEALRALAVPSGRAAIVTDIGCVGLADSLFPTTHTVHTLHGRSVAIAAGLRMAERRPTAPPLKPVVLIGDGGVGIGLLHVVHAAQMNVEVTVLVHNNLIYGMTGGQHSVLTPAGLKTTTTPAGAPLPALDLGAILGGAGAGFFARTVAPGDDLVATIVEAMRHPGFACIEVFDLCPTFATAVGGVGGKDLKAIPERAGLALGILRKDASRPPLASTWTDAPEEPVETSITPEPTWRSIDRTARVVVAGRAGERVQSAALLAGAAATAAGLSVTMRTDSPVTQGTGFSLAELTFAPEPIAYTGLVDPDVVVVTAAEGAGELLGRGLLAPGAARRWVMDASLPVPEGLAPVQRDLRTRYGAKAAALGALVEEIDRAGWWDRRAWSQAIAQLPASRRSAAEAVLAKAR